MLWDRLTLRRRTGTPAEAEDGDRSVRAGLGVRSRRMLALIGGVVVGLLLVGTAGGWLLSRPQGAMVQRRAQTAPSARAAVPLQAVSPAPPSAIIPPGRSLIRVPILEYHYIRVNPDPRDRVGFGLSVTPTAFAEQMEWLASHGYHAVTIADLRDYFSERRPLPAKAVVLAFDDGYQDFYTAAAPILRAHGFTAVSYVIPGFFGRRAYMTKPELQELDRAGIEIGSHTVNHEDLTRLDPASRQIELVASRSVLEQVLGHPVVDFCYPSGKFNAAVVAAVQLAGYQSATTELRGTTLGWSDRFTWERVRVNGGEPLNQFVANLGAPEPWVPDSAGSTLPKANVGGASVESGGSPSATPSPV